MNPHNSKAKCPKCGDRKIRTWYCAGGCFEWNCSQKIESEHLHKRCETCHYEWPEKCVENKKLEEK